MIQPPPGFTPLLYPAYDKLFLPWPEFKNLKGNPLEFKSFITNFETRVEPRVQNKKMLFCLLLQHFKSLLVVQNFKIAFNSVGAFIPTL